jgi:hypothetical protein
MNGRRTALVFAGLSGLAVLVGCGSETALVGGRCADGFEPFDGRCVAGAPAGDFGAGGPGGGPASPGQAATASGVVTPPPPSDPNAAGAPPAGPPTSNAPLSCAPPEVECLGRCMRVDGDDADNCGACGKICPSNICVKGVCQGATPGDVVLIGHDFATAASGTAQTRVLLNALTIPTTNPIRVLSLEAAADVFTVAHTKTLAAVGIPTRRVAFSTATEASELVTPSLASSYDVVLLHRAPPGDASAAGALVGPSLEAFAKKGGVVVAIDDGSSPMPELLTSAGLLTVAGHTVLPESTHLAVTSSQDAVARQLISPFATRGRPVSFQGAAPPSTEISWVVRAIASPGPGDPIVIHRAVP